MLNFFIGAWISISPFQGQSDTTSVILAEWYYQTDTTIAYDISNYTITDSTRDFIIYSLEKIDSVPEGNCPITYLVGLVTEKIPYKTFLYCTAKGYGTDYFYNYGFVPNKIQTPNLELR